MTAHHTFPVFSDQFGIGQRRVAEIRKQVSAGKLLECARVLLDTQYHPEEWVECHANMYRHFRGDYDKAEAILK